MEAKSTENQFADAFLKGIEAAEKASQHRSEIEKIIEVASQQLSQATNGKLQIRWSNEELQACNPQSSSKDWRAFARMLTQTDIFPVILQHEASTETCHEVSAVSDGLCALLASAHVGSILRSVTDQN